MKLIADRHYDEDNETVKFDVTVGNNVGGGTFTHTYIINDDDATPTIYFSNVISFNKYRNW